MKPTVFHILGAGRSGTSLLSALLDEHPGCEVVFEVLSMTHFVAPDLDGEHLDPLMRVAARVSRFKTSCDDHSRRSSADFWGHKTTTEHILALSYAPIPFSKDYSRIDKEFGSLEFREINIFLEALTGYNVVFIVRNGRSCIASKVARTGQSYAEAGRRWNYSIRVLKALKATHEKLHVVRFEDLVIEPEKTLSRVCSFLEIEYSSAMLEGTANPKMPAYYRRTHFDSRTVVEKDIPPLVADDISENMRYLGYPSGP